MSEFRFFAFTDYEYYNNRSLNFFQLPIAPFQPTKKTTVDEISHELNIPYTIFEILVAICAIIGNLMVIIVFQRERKLRRRTNYYIVSLAIADFLVGFLGVPFAVLASIGLPTNLHACLFTVSLLVVLCTISIFCLVAVSVDRYWAILYPMAYSRNVRTKTAIVIISMCWVAGTVVGFLPLFGWHAAVDHNQACLFVEVMDYNYLVFLYFATIITPAMLMLAFYAHIYKVIVKQVRQIVTMNPVGDSSCRSSIAQMANPMKACHGGTMLKVLGAARKRDVKATQNLAIIVLFFMVCWIPLYTINCIQAFCPSCSIHPKLTLFCIILSHLNSAVNPVLYAYHLKDFRLALKNLILKVMGFEIDQTLEGQHRYSLASQHRLHKMDTSIRNPIHTRIYIDSPVWLRQQQQSLKNSEMIPKCGAVIPSLNNKHETVAAVTSVTTDIEREMWDVSEASSDKELGEVNYIFPEKYSAELPSSHIHHRKSRRKNDCCDSPFFYSNSTYTPSHDGNDDFEEAFLPHHHQTCGGDRNALSKSLMACANRSKLYSDTDEQPSNASNSQDDYAIARNEDSKLTAPKNKAKSQNYSSNLMLTQAKPISSKQNQTFVQISTSNDSLNNSSIFIVEAESNERSPGHKPKFRKTLKPLNINSKSLRRSFSCDRNASTSVQMDLKYSLNSMRTNSTSTITHASNQHISLASDYQPYQSSSNNNNNLNYYTLYSPSHYHRSQLYHKKVSPFKAMSNFILPPIAQHSSLFHLFHTANAETVQTSGNDLSEHQISHNLNSSMGQERDGATTSEVNFDSKPGVGLSNESSTLQIRTER